ncbi:hypothetical protein AMTR_s00026p00236260, partial [Amborella trichopoda]
KLMPQYHGSSNAHNIPFNVSNGPKFHEMVYAINHGPKGYMPPQYVRTSLLDRERSKIERALASLRNDWTTYVSRVEAMFLDGHDCSSKENISQNITNILLKAINSIGTYNTVQVVTDNATN